MARAPNVFWSIPLKVYFAGGHHGQGSILQNSTRDVVDWHSNVAIGPLLYHALDNDR